MTETKKPMPSIEWEKLQHPRFGSTARCAVPGGWLVRVSIGDGGGVCFVPDPSHLWDGNNVRLTVDDD